LRGFVGFTLLAHVAAYVTTTRVHTLGWIVVSLSLISAACLLVGFMTPVIAIVVIIGAGALAVFGQIQSALEIIILTVAVALLGPGAFSLDARMFGRREILLPKHTARSPKS
jgi:uncharacterized membrane protein YphA (DoxX/SURF4 family)